MIVKELRKLQRAILREPRRFAMLTWMEKIVGGYNEYDKTSQGWHTASIRFINKPPCGATGCMAGLTVINSKGIRFAERHSGENIREIAVKILGLDVEQAHCLFDKNNWPEPFARQYDDRVDVEQRPKLPAMKKNARVAAAVIDHLIEHGTLR